VFAGGGEEEHWSLAMMFDAMGALSSGYNETPELASRAYDAARDGFVIAAGGGMLVLEELEHARARGARIYAEIIGYGATSDGDNMVAPSGEGAVRCMQQAIAGIDSSIDYINTHGTSTPLGDIAELNAIRQVFGETVPPFSSSKSLCGHSLGAAGVQEAIHCLLMLEQDFMAGSINIKSLDERAVGLPVLLKTRENAGINTVMTNNFGFGGTNASLIFQRHRD
jgi:3-oxoacyl-[acyl-carrier-protein] synthase-1